MDDHGTASEVDSRHAGMGMVGCNIMAVGQNANSLNVWCVQAALTTNSLRRTVVADHHSIAERRQPQPSVVGGAAHV